MGILCQPRRLHPPHPVGSRRMHCAGRIRSHKHVQVDVAQSDNDAGNKLAQADSMPVMEAAAGEALAAAAAASAAADDMMYDAFDPYDPYCD